MQAKSSRAATGAEDEADVHDTNAYEPRRSCAATMDPSVADPKARPTSTERHSFIITPSLFCVAEHDRRTIAKATLMYCRLDNPCRA